MKHLGFLLLLWSQIGLFYGQDKFELNGSMSVKNYIPSEYGGGAQVFGLEILESGYVAVGHIKGISLYDGQRWDQLIFPEKFAIRGLRKCGLDSLIAIHNLGYSIISPGANASIAIEHHFSETEFMDFFIMNNQKYLRSTKAFYELDNNFDVGNSFKTNNISMPYISDSLFFFGNGNNKILSFNGSKISLYKEFKLEAIEENESILPMHQFNGNDYLFLDYDGIYRLDGDSLTRVYSDQDLSLRKIEVIDDKYLLLGTSDKGLLIFDTNINLVQSVNNQNGLKNETVSYLRKDKQGQIWLGTDNGISKIHLNSPILNYANFFDNITIEGLVHCEGELVMATGGGCYSLLENGTAIKNTNIYDDCYGIDKIALGGDTAVYVSALEGVYQYRGNNRAKQICDGGPYQVIKNPKEDSALYIVNFDGIQKLVLNEKGNFEEINYIRNFSGGEPYNMVIDDQENLWIATKPDDGVYKTHVDIFENNNIGFEHFSKESGLPHGAVFLSIIDKKLFAGTEDGLFYLDKSSNKFLRDQSVLFDFENSGLTIHRINSDLEGNIWMSVVDNFKNEWTLGYASPNDNNTYQWHPESFEKYKDNAVHSMYHQDKNRTWLAGTGSLISFDKRNETKINFNFQAKIRGVYYGNDTLFGGYGNVSEGLSHEYQSKTEINFEFASNSFLEEDKILFSYRLVGFNEEWSQWSPLSSKDFTLLEGDYIFEVKAKSIGGEISEISQYRFSILPPWYRTWYAVIGYVIIGIILIYLIIRLSLYRARQQNIKLEKIIDERTEEVVAQKEEAEKQKQIIEEKNDEIIDSINYAKRLQNAILTPNEVIEKSLDNFFILYIPKDIVAGDFYWTNLARLNSRDSLDLIACADCTGHGVPGAMVSMVCSNALDKAAKTEDIYKPGQILDSVTDQVIETFEQSTEDVKDGMDIAICGIDKRDDHTIVEFAGANNPLWIISESNTILVDGEDLAPNYTHVNLNLFEVKANKQPVGSYAERSPFDTKEIKLNHGDKIYMFTDGFADQFGGEKGKKLKYKPFKQLLLDLRNVKVADQKQYLSEYFYDWKEGYEQIDDVCVIGIEV